MKSLFNEFFLIEWIPVSPSFIHLQNTIRKTNYCVLSGLKGCGGPEEVSEEQAVWWEPACTSFPRRGVVLMHDSFGSVENVKLSGCRFFSYWTSFPPSSHRRFHSTASRGRESELLLPDLDPVLLFKIPATCSTRTLFFFLWLHIFLNVKAAVNIDRNAIFYDLFYNRKICMILARRVR